MNQRTYELLARWISKETKITVEFGDMGPCADVKNNRIFLPSSVKESNVFAVLAWLIHEAAHLRYSKFPDDLSAGKVSHDIINAIEDIRIDNANFNLLPNIRDFYERMIRDHVITPENIERMKKAPLLTRSLIQTILRQEGFPELPDPEAIKKCQETDLGLLVDEAKQHINNKNWTKVKTVVAEIMKRFGVKEIPKEEGISVEIEIGVGIPTQGSGSGSGQSGNGDQKQAQDSGNGKDDQAQGSGKGKGTGIHIDGLDVEKYLHPASMWGKGHLVGPSAAATSPQALQDATKQAFKELLNIKETRIVHDGVKLDIDNLTDFFTGEIENLFQDDDTIKRKKSKIMFLLDGSGSMGGALLDGKSRRNVLTKCVKALTIILDEVRETEGIEIQYEINAFTSNFEKLNQDNWEKEYSSMGGGTNIIDAFKKTQEELLNDPTIDGKKLVIVITDGDVSQGEIEEVRKEILRHNEDVRCMFIGIGASIFMKRDIIGDNNIIMSEMADQVIMDVIMEML
jgi:hypothetical protein